MIEHVISISLIGMITTQGFSWTILRVSQKNVGARMVHNTNVQQSIVCTPPPPQKSSEGVGMKNLIFKREGGGGGGGREGALKLKVR